MFSVRVPSRLRTEAGFTLIELLVVILIIGILAAIAIPAFLSQRAKGQDASAKSDLNRVVKMVEECRLEKSSYTSCDEQSELNSAPGIDWGTGEGQSGVYALYSSTDTYAAYSISKSKTSSGRNHVFAWVKNPDGGVSRMCLDTNQASQNDGSCKNGTW